MWQLFYDLNLKVEEPQNCSAVTWPAKASFVEIHVQTPDDVQLSCGIQYNNFDVENGSLAQFDNDRNLWQLYCAPEHTGQHELIVFDKHNSEVKSGCVLKFYLNVTQLHRSMKFPTFSSQFQHNKCHNVNLTIDLEWAKEKGNHDPILKRSIAVGSKEVTLYAEYGQKPSYDMVLKCSVQ